MIAAWMLYATAVGLLLTAASTVLERAARAVGIPVRVFWMAAIVATLVWPVAAQLRESSAPPVVSLSAATDASAATTGLSPMVSVASAPAPIFDWRKQIVRVESAVERFDRSLAVIWGVVSLLLMASVVRSVIAIRRAQRAWHRGVVDGVRVLVAPEAGPAVVGLGALEIVLPRWALALDADSRHVVLRHEEEHRRARDPYLLLIAALGIAAMPWNVALWLQRRRLRLAIELDCDARVLRHVAEPQRYGSLLLTVAAHRRPGLWTAATALIEPVTNLERRITVMMQPKPRHPRALAGALASLAVAALSIAAIAPAPDAIAFRRQSSVPQQSKVYTEKEVDVKARLVAPLTPVFPAEGNAVARFVVGVDGRVNPKSLTIQSTQRAFADAVKAHVTTARFEPAFFNGARVPQQMEMRFEFNRPTKSVASTTPKAKPSSTATSKTPADSSVAKTVAPAKSDSASVVVSGGGGGGGRGTIDSSLAAVLGSSLGALLDRGRAASVTLGRSADSVSIQLSQPSNSIASKSPIYIVDGVPLTNPNLTSTDFLHLDIDAIEVVRGAGAVGLYGTRAEGGAILITTKAGATSTSGTRTGGGRGSVVGTASGVRGGAPGAMTVTSAATVVTTTDTLGIGPVALISPLTIGRQEALGLGPVYYDFQVEQQVKIAAGNRAPDYPKALRERQIEGSVSAQFVVDVDGRAIVSTFREVSSTHPLFTNTVITHLPNLRFIPATIAGSPVKQMVTMPFVFSLSK